MLIHLLSSLRHYDYVFVSSVGCMAASNLILVFVVLHLVTSEVLCMYKSWCTCKMRDTSLKCVSIYDVWCDVQIYHYVVNERWTVNERHGTWDIWSFVTMLLCMCDMRCLDISLHIITYHCIFLKCEMCWIMTFHHIYDCYVYICDDRVSWCICYVCVCMMCDITKRQDSMYDTSSEMFWLRIEAMCHYAYANMHTTV